MKKNIFWLFLCFSYLFPWSLREARAVDEKGRYVFAYLENGQYTDFTRQKEIIFEHLDKLGLKDRYVIPDDLFFSPGWNAEQKDLEIIAEEIMARDDVDLIFSMGTVATKSFLAKNNNKTPIVGVAISDPYRSGIIKNEKESGTDNLAALYIPNVWLQIFNGIYDIVEFKKLGIIFEDTLNGRSYANLEDSIEAGRTLGFEVVKYPFYDTKAPFESCLKGVDYLIEQGIDVLFLSDIECFDQNIVDAKAIIEKANTNKIMTISNLGDLHIDIGALISVSSSSAKGIGNFYAERIKKILEENVTPASLGINGVFTPEIIINFDTAQKIGIDFSLPVLLSADKIYDEKVVPNE